MARLLVDAVRGVTDGAYEALPDDPRTVVEAAGLHRVTPAVARVARARDDLPSAWRPALAGARTAQMLRHLRTTADLRVIGGALDAAGIAWAAFKGPVLTHAVWPAADMREYLDLDVLVDPRRAEDALEAVLATGAAMVDRNWPLLRDSRRAELALTGVHGTAVDLHWHVLVPPAQRRRFTVPVLDLLERRRWIDLGQGVDVPVLDATDQLHHLALHTLVGGANRLMWLGDLHYAARDPELDAGRLRHDAERARSALGVGMVLARTAAVLGVPGTLREAFRGAVPRPWEAVVQARDGRTPFPGLPGDRHLGGALYAGARRTVAGSSVGLLRDALDARRYARRGHAGIYEVEPLGHDVPDARARAEYFAAASAAPDA
ncbi:nucleotidyltransferase family protein [Cellulosimicrobium marinum]|uniref:nucleotidyltransferase family protein n=1 Tax=Cellulosimicrobium marinum TaxID=1638992 RepID=UPI001E6054CB|nr:nucleotidyltransferase family protein [Cellulosimicrobium marinum]